MFLQTFKTTNERPQTWRVKDVSLHSQKCNLDNILILLTWSGCDTTTGIYGMGKILSAYRCKDVIECKQNLTFFQAEKPFFKRQV